MASAVESLLFVIDINIYRIAIPTIMMLKNLIVGIGRARLQVTKAGTLSFIQVRQRRASVVSGQQETAVAGSRSVRSAGTRVRHGAAGARDQARRGVHQAG